MGSVIWNVVGLVEIFSRTSLECGNCKSSASNLECICWDERGFWAVGLSSDAARPGADGGISAAVRME